MTDTSKIEELLERLEALHGLLQNQIELNPSNYDHDDACRLNAEAVEIASNGLADIPEAATTIRALLEREAKLREAIHKALDRRYGEWPKILQQALQETDNAG